MIQHTVNNSMQWTFLQVAQYKYLLFELPVKIQSKIIKLFCEEEKPIFCYNKVMQTKRERRG
jgi:hypothetical protein